MLTTPFASSIASLLGRRTRRTSIAHRATGDRYCKRLPSNQHIDLGQVAEATAKIDFDLAERSRSGNQLGGDVAHLVAVLNANHASVIAVSKCPIGNTVVYVTETPGAGLYDDGSGSRRYWDGEKWTEYFQVAYEYQVVGFTTSSFKPPGPALTQKMNELAEQGWRVVNVTATGGGNSTIVAFERPKPRAM